MSISAIVRTWNSDRTLARTLASLRRQTEAVDEIVIVDSGSTDRTRAIADRYGCRWIDYPSGQPFNYSEALNLGIAQARGSLLLIISSHTVLAFRDIVARMSASLSGHDAAGVYCKHRRFRSQFPRRDDPRRGSEIEVTRAESFRGYNGLSNSCALIERASWELHPFDRSMPSAEDQEWAQWMFRNTSRPTVRLGNAGVLYLNRQHSIAKEVRDHIVIATRLLPSLRAWRAIFGMYRRSARAMLLGHGENARRDFAIATGLIRSRFYAPSYGSRYYGGLA